MMPLSKQKELQKTEQENTQNNNFAGNKQFSHEGFTLIELMIVVAIVGILALVAVPSFSEQVRQNRLVSNANQLQSVFKFARSEAAKRNQQVTLVANGGNWEVTLNDNTILQQFIPSNTIVVNNLANLTVLPTGGVNAAVNLVITDNDNETNDFDFTVLMSGQTTLIQHSSVTTPTTLDNT